MCLGLEPGVAGWKEQTNPLSYGSTPSVTDCLLQIPPNIPRTSDWQRPSEESST